jgi:hypothetical protein
MKDWKKSLEKIKETIKSDEKLMSKEIPNLDISEKNKLSKVKMVNKTNNAEQVLLIAKKKLIEKSTPLDKRGTEKEKIRGEKEKERIKRKKEIELTKEAKLLFKEYEIKECDFCKNGVEQTLCPECNGTKFSSLRSVLETVSATCSNTSPNCPHCFGTGVYTQVKEVFTTECSCKTGMLRQKCKSCNGTGLSVKAKLQAELNSKQIIKLLSLKNKNDLLQKIKQFLNS